MTGEFGAQTTAVENLRSNPPRAGQMTHDFTLNPRLSCRYSLKRYPLPPLLFLFAHIPCYLTDK